jgi:glycosyltransferase involved in cell wall biosynthesis
MKSPRRKALALSLFEGKNLREASCLHATSAAEMGDIRSFGLKGPIALIPNGISVDWLHSTGEAERFREKFGIPKERRIAFFLSRITPKKGLPMLLDAWADHRHRLRDWCLVIAGSDEFSHLSALVAHVKAASLSDSVIFLGPLYGTDKRDAFAASDVFVLPSHGEGAPMAVLDALGAGVPVLTTQRTPWEDLCKHRCGWWVPDTTGPIGDALVDMSQLSREDLVSWGSRGKDLVSASYSWESSAEKCHQLYLWLLRLAERPQCVQTD